MTNEISTSLILPLNKEQEQYSKVTCKGLFFRGHSNLFYTKNKVRLNQSVTLLKRMSCPGCEKCGWMLEDLAEIISCENLIFPDIAEGGLYTLIVSNISTDWETGLVDSYALEFKEIVKKDSAN